MTFSKTLVYIVVFSLLIACKPSQKNSSSSKPDPAIAYLGNTPVGMQEFKYVYEKNATRSDSLYQEASLREYLDLYLKFKLKVLDAQAQGIDTTKAFKTEYSVYENQLAQPYLKVKDVTDSLVRQAYDRLKEEINAAHILIRVSPEAEPADTLEAYNKIKDIRQKALKGEDFTALARQYSQDPSASTNGGDLGYFTSLKMVYPFEQAAYTTAKGSISQIIRTQFGYHILKVNDRRPARGKVKIAHILLRTAKGMSAEDSLEVRRKVFEIYDKLKKGENWSELAKQFSEDQNTKDNGGELKGEFGAGDFSPEFKSFEDAAFGLQNPNDFTAPVSTPLGWHIVKLLSKTQLEPFEQMKEQLALRISRDSRSELGKTIFLEKIKKENNLKIDEKNLSKAVSAVDSTVLSGKWSLPANLEYAKDGVLSFNNPAVKISRTYTVQEFLDYVQTKQTATRSEVKNPAHFVRLLFGRFVNDKAMEFEKSLLAYKYEEYKMLAKEYREGMMLFSMMNDKVWGKAISDTIGARKYFEDNQSRYNWGIRAKATIFDVADEKILKEVKEMASEKRFPVKDIQPETIYFIKNSATLPNDMLNKLVNLAGTLQNDPSLTLEIQGHIDPTEAALLSEERIKAINNYLIAKGTKVSQIIRKNYGKTKLASRTDNSKNRRVEFQVYSSSIKALEKTLNATNPLNIKIQEGLFEKGDNSILDAVEWKTGTQSVNLNGRVAMVQIETIEQPRPKAFEEARGNVISDYQTYLEEQWIKELKERYPVRIEEKEVQKLVKK